MKTDIQGTRGSSQLLILMCLGLGTIAITSLSQISDHFKSSYTEVQRNVVKRDYRDLVNQVYTINKAGGLSCGCLYANIFRNMTFTATDIRNTSPIQLDSLNVYEDTASAGCTTNVALNLARTSSASLPSGVPHGLPVKAITIKDFRIINELITATLMIDPIQQLTLGLGISGNYIEPEAVPISFHAKYDPIAKTFSYGGCSSPTVDIKGADGPAQWNEYFESPKQLVKLGQVNTSVPPGVYYDNTSSLDQHPYFLFTQQLDNNTQVPCDPNNRTFGYNCIHGGEVRYFDLEGFSKCDGSIFVKDTSGDESQIFGWRCFEMPSQNKLRFITMGAGNYNSAVKPVAAAPLWAYNPEQPFKSLSRLLKRDTWKNMSVTVSIATNSTVIAEKLLLASSQPKPWWINKVEPLPLNPPNPVTGSCLPKVLTNLPAGPDPKHGVIYTINENRINCAYRIGPPSGGVPKKLVDKIGVVALREEYTYPVTSNVFVFTDELLYNIQWQIQVWNTFFGTNLDINDPDIIRKFWIIMQINQTAVANPVGGPGGSVNFNNFDKKNLGTPQPDRLEAQLAQSAATFTQYYGQYVHTLAPKAGQAFRFWETDFAWLEASIDGMGGAFSLTPLVNVNEADYMTLTNSTVQNAHHVGVQINGVRSSRFNEINIYKSANYGLIAYSAEKSYFKSVRSQDNGLDGLHFYSFFTAPIGNSISNITTIRNGGNGLTCFDCQSVPINAVTALENAGHGIHISALQQRVSDLNIKNIRSVRNGLSGMTIEADPYYLPSRNIDIGTFLASENGTSGLVLHGATDVLVQGMETLHNQDVGFYGENLTSVRFDGGLTRSIYAFNNKNGGMHIKDATGLSMYRLSAMGNTGNGIYLEDVSSPRMVEIATHNNTRSGLVLGSNARGGSLGFLLSAHNGENGLKMMGPSNFIANATFASNAGHGVYILGDNRLSPAFTEKSTLHNVVSVNNGKNGLYAAQLSHGLFSNWATVDNGSRQIQMAAPSGMPTAFKDKLIIPAGNRCYTPSPASSGFDSFCNPAGSSSFAKLHVSSLKSSFVGKGAPANNVYQQGLNIATLNMASGYPGSLGGTNTSNLASSLQNMWGKTGDYGTAGSRGYCNSSSCNRWSWRLKYDISNPLYNKSQNLAGNPAPCVVSGDRSLVTPTGVAILSDAFALFVSQPIPNTNPLQFEGLSHVYTPHFGWEQLQPTLPIVDPFWAGKSCTFTPGAFPTATIYPKYPL